MNAFLIAALTVAAAPADVPAATDSADVQRDDIIVTGRREEDGYTASDQRTATRLSLTPRETPQSVSTVTRAQIEDFQLNDINALLTTTTGVNVNNAETDRFTYAARGFDILNFQFDGIGQPNVFSGYQTGPIDTATFERVEILRGATGLLSPTGNPSAVINFVRKRPTRDFRAQASALYGSFDQVRVEGDVSAPLTADGSVRTRLVGSYLDADSYLDRYQTKRSVLYGIVEADLGPDTVIAAGYSRQDSRSDGVLWGSLPLAFTDGTRTNYPRSTSTSAPWSFWNVLDQQIFGDLTHGFGEGWTLRVSALRRAVDEDERLFYVYGLPNRQTGDGLFSYPGAFQGPTRDLVLDANVTGPLAAFGREHEIVFGINRGTTSLRQDASYPPAGTPLPGNSAFDGSFPLPVYPPFTIGAADFSTRRETAYALARLNLSDDLKLMAGGNLTHATARGISYAVDRGFEATRFLPFVGATYDLSDWLSAYASYATVFNPQFELSEDLTTLPPITGDNLEGGLKASWFEDRLYASAALFKVRQNNTAEGARFDTTLGQQLFRAVDATSEGIEFDVAGQPMPGLNVSGGFTALRLRGQEGERVRSFIPRRTGRLNVTYTPADLPQATIGAAIQYQSAIDRDLGTPALDGSVINVRQGDYALVDLLGRYELTPGLTLAANIRNVTNVKAISSLIFDQSFWIAPRTATLTLGYRF